MNHVTSLFLNFHIFSQLNSFISSYILPFSIVSRCITFIFWGFSLFICSGILARFFRNFSSLFIVLSYQSLSLFYSFINLSAFYTIFFLFKTFVLELYHLILQVLKRAILKRNLIFVKTTFKKIVIL